MADGKNYPRVTVGVYIINNKGRLLLVKTPQWKNKWIAPGGHVELGEKIEKTAAREAKERTGLKIDNLELIDVIERPDIQGEYEGAIKHLVGFQYKASCQNEDSAIIGDKETAEYAWHKPETWLNLDIHPITETTIAKIINQKDNWEHKYKRALADYQNLLKRTAKEKEEFAKFANEGLVQEIVPVYDNLKISLGHIDEAARENGWAEGIKHVVRQFKDVLAGLGVEEIGALGKGFDPNCMEALEGKGEKVEKVVKPGYKLNGKVILPAKVILEK